MTLVRSVAGSDTFANRKRAADRTLVAVQGGRVRPSGQVQVGPAVVVAVEGRHAAAHEVGELAGVGVVDARGRGLLDEAGDLHRRLAGARQRQADRQDDGERDQRPADRAEHQPHRRPPTPIGSPGVRARLALPPVAGIGARVGGGAQRSASVPASRSMARPGPGSCARCGTSRGKAGYRGPRTGATDLSSTTNGLRRLPGCAMLARVPGTADRVRATPRQEGRHAYPRSRRGRPVRRTGKAGTSQGRSVQKGGFRC